MSGDKSTDPFSFANLQNALPGLTGTDRQLMANAIQEKLQTLVGKSSGYLESLPPKVQGRIAALKELQKAVDAHREKFEEEKTALELKYQVLYDPLFAKRAEIVTGAVEPPEALEAEATNDDSKGVPGFWLTALQNHVVLDNQITDKDRGALAFLWDVKSTLLTGDPKGFKLDFYFDENPYFTNSVLSKEYHMEEDEIIDKAIGTKIDWKAGKNLTQRIMKKKPKKGSKDTKIITKTEDVLSFFSFFSPPEVPEGDDEDGVDDDIMEQMEADYEIGFLLKEKIIPNAVSWFTGEAEDNEYIEEDDDEDDEDDEDDDDEDDDDEDDDDEEEEDDDEDEDGEEVEQKKKVKKSSAKKGKGIQAVDGEKPECKQQ